MSFEDRWEKRQRTGDPGFLCSLHTDTGLLALFTGPMDLRSRPLPILFGRKQCHQQQIIVWSLGASGIFSVTPLLLCQAVPQQPPHKMSLPSCSCRIHQEEMSLLSFISTAFPRKEPSFLCSVTGRGLWQRWEDASWIGGASFEAQLHFWPS